MFYHVYNIYILSNIYRVKKVHLFYDPKHSIKMLRRMLNLLQVPITTYTGNSKPNMPENSQIHQV